MEDAEKTMIENIPKKTGKSLEEWIDIIKSKGFKKHGEIMKFLKGDHSITHGYANYIAQSALKADAPDVSDEDLINDQYSGKEHFFPLYKTLIERISGFGDDIEIAPKKSYVSLRRSKQFALLKPATKTRFEIGLNIKDQGSEDILQKIEKKNSMCSHNINISSVDDINDDVIKWLKTAYDGAK